MWICGAAVVTSALLFYCILQTRTDQMYVIKLLVSFAIKTLETMKVLHLGPSYMELKSWQEENSCWISFKGDKNGFDIIYQNSVKHHRELIQTGKIFILLDMCYQLWGGMNPRYWTTAKQHQSAMYLQGDDPAVQGSLFEINENPLHPPWMHYVLSKSFFLWNAGESSDSWQLKKSSFAWT